MSSPRTLSPRLLLCLSSALLGCQPAQQTAQPSTAARGALAERPSAMVAAGRSTDLDLVAGGDWQAGFSVATDSYLQLVVEQRNLDVSVEVLDPEGGAVAAADGSGGIGVDERLALRLPAGDYRLVLRPRLDGVSKGRVRLRIEALRPFEPLDPERLRLILLGQEAAHLDGASAQAGWERAIRLSNEELAGWRRIGDVKAIIRTLTRLASLERALGRLEPSIRHGEEAVALSLEAGLDKEEAASRYWLAQSLNRAGRVSAAAAEFELGLPPAERAGDLVLQGRILNWQGRMSYNRGDLAQARRLYRRALDLRRRAHDTRGIQAAINNLAVIAQKMGDFTTALELYEEAIETARQLEDPSSELLAINNLSSLLSARGQWQEALDSLAAGLEFARANDDPRNESILGRQLADRLWPLGEPERARRLLLRSLELDEARKNSADQASVLCSLAHMELSLGNLLEAESWMVRAYELSTHRALSSQKDRAARGLAALRRAQGRPDQALQLLGSVIDDARLSKQPIRLARALKDLGETHLDLGDAAAALRQFEGARDILGGLQVPEIRFDIAYLVARAKYIEGDLIAAINEIEDALGTIETLRLSVDDPDLRATFLARTRQAYSFAVARLLELDSALPGQGHDRRAFATLERARARSLVEMLSRARFGAENVLDTSLLETERNALSVVTNARERLNQAAEEGRTEDFAGLRSQLEASRDRLAQAEQALRTAEPRYAALRYADNYAASDLQALLEPGVALIEYSLQPDRSVAFIVSKDSFEVVELAAEETIERHAELLREILTSPNRRAYETLLSRARQLGDLVVAPLTEAIDDSHHLIVVPDGALAQVPFEALRLGQGELSEDIFLVEKWAISYSQSAGVLRSLKREQWQSNSRSGLVAFADPEPPEPSLDWLGDENIGWPRLPGARIEVAAIAASLEKLETATYFDTRASEQALKQDPAIGQARWIHLASHARIDHRSPADSAIVLAPTGSDDGYLTVQEIFALELNADLVVLSGCETALGRQIRGEGLIGLTRAFLYAGARGLQVSLWKVSDDTTPALMVSFYSNLSRDMGVAQALRAAKLASLADSRRSHPFYWAPFVLIGA